MDNYDELKRQKDGMEAREDFRAITRVADRMFQIAADHGFHDGETVPEVSKERMAIYVANLHDECSELWEAVRKGTLSDPCDKGIGLSNAEEELADIVIRAMDAAVAMGINIGGAIRMKSEYNKTRPFMHGKKC